MVHFTRALVIAASFFAVAFGTPTPTKRTVAQVETDLRNIATQVQTLDTQIRGFPASGLAGALAIHNSAAPLNTAIQQCTTDVNNTGAVGDADSIAILGIVQGFLPNILDALSRISMDRAAFDAQPIGGLSALVRVDLQNLSASTQALSNALAANAAAAEKPAATSIESVLATAFATAIAAYQ
ncbi:Hydrophobic surface binding protein [Mycena kentingensis (nom. inval.)]|nr:Hydrophobic surface binding protein [Mycena kentingensis (nom. inval.)]